MKCTNTFTLITARLEIALKHRITRDVVIGWNKQHLLMGLARIEKTVIGLWFIHAISQFSDSWIRGVVSLGKTFCFTSGSMSMNLLSSPLLSKCLYPFDRIHPITNPKYKYNTTPITNGHTHQTLPNLNELPGHSIVVFLVLTSNICLQHLYPMVSIGHITCLHNWYKK